MPPIWKSHLDSLQITSLADIFRTAKPVIGMVHCWPMPGAPGYQGYGMRDIIRHAQSDAEALIAGGCDGIIVENMWDIPFRAGAHIPPESIAAHAVVAAAVRDVCPVPILCQMPVKVVLHRSGQVRRVGFAYVDCYGSPAATPYDHAADRLVFRTRRH
jgi:hypothetical protein